MGCIPSVLIRVKFGKGRPAATPDDDGDGQDLAMSCLQRTIPAALAATGGGSAKGIASKLFRNEVERQEFIRSAYMALQGNDEFLIRDYEIILSFPRAEERKGFHGALRAVDKDQKPVRSIQSQQYGETQEMAFAALVDWVERLARQILAHPDVCVIAPKVVRTIAEETRGATTPQVIESPWISQPPRRHHPNVALARDGMIQNSSSRDVTKRYGRYYPSGQSPSGHYPIGQYPAVERDSSMAAFLQFAPLDDDGNRELSSAGAYGQFRPTVERHSAIDTILQPVAVNDSQRRRKTSTAENRMSSRSMQSIQERPLTLMEEADIRRSASYGNMLQTARRSYPVSASHQLYYEKDGNGPPTTRRSSVWDPSVVSFQGNKRRKDRLYMTGLPSNGSGSACMRKKSPEMLQRQSQSGIQNAILAGASRSAEPDHHRQNLSHGGRDHAFETGASIARNSFASTQPEYYQQERAVASSNAPLPARNRSRNTSTIIAKQPVIKAPSRQYRSTEAIIARESTVSFQPSIQDDTRAMVSGISDSSPPSAPNQDIEFILSGSPHSVAPPVPRAVRNPSPARSEFGGLKPVKCTRKAADPEGRPIARFESMKSSTSLDATSFVSGDAAKPFGRLPRVDDRRAMECEASG